MRLLDRSLLHLSVALLLVLAVWSTVFFFVVLGAVIDVVAGFTIGIRVARRDLSIGADT